MAIDVHFWGVRGTCPATGAAFARYGGETMCVEVRCGETRIVLDAGSGLRDLGEHMMRQPPMRTHVLLSHLHLDHIMGLPHFAPLWSTERPLDFWAAREYRGGEAALAITRPPFFPLDAMPGAPRAHGFTAGDVLDLGCDVQVKTFALSHAGECTGFRIEYAGATVCYITDHEHGDPSADVRVLHAVRGADLLIYDSTFTDSELPAHAGWGHSTWEEGVRLKQRADISLVALAHHEPRRTDAELDFLSGLATALSSNVVFARQGMELAV